MAKLSVVLTLTSEDVTDEDKQSAASLKPASRLTDEELAIYDRIAPLLAAHGRLSESSIDYVVEYCRITADLDELAQFIRGSGRTYVVTGRNGQQVKNRPEVGERHELRRQQRGYGTELGLSPQAELQLARAAMPLQRDLMDEYGSDENSFTRDQAAADAHIAANGTTRH